MIRLEIIWLRVRTDPFEAFCGVLCAFAGVPLAFGKLQPQSIDALMHPEWIAHLWGFLVLIGGISVTVGMFLRGLRLEQAGLNWLGGSCTAYGLCAVAFAGSKGLYAAVLLWGLAGACAFRAHEYTLVMRGAKGSRSEE